MKYFRYIIVFCLLSFSAAVFTPLKAQEAQNNPYADNKLFHMGFQLGLNVCSFDRRDGEAAVVPAPGVGFHVAFVTDLRLCKYLNLRFTPGMEFKYRDLDANISNKSVFAIPLNIPLYLKFSAERLGNFRPYVIGGGGISIDWNSTEIIKKEGVNRPPVGLRWLDYFCEVGFGCDIYFPWFKLCPEITYRIGFADQFDPKGSTVSPIPLYNQAICITFNFE